MFKKIACLIPALLLLATVPAQAGAMPDQMVRETTDEILELLKKNRATYEKDTTALYQMVYKHVLPHFDFRKMSQQVLARNWRAASEEQRARFTEEFKDLLVRTYSTALLKYTDEDVVYLPFRADADAKRVEVKTEIKRAAGGPNIPLNYRFYRTDSEWKVYDVAIEGISLVTNYRNVYDEKIRKEGLDALITSLAADNTQTSRRN